MNPAPLYFSVKRAALQFAHGAMKSAGTIQFSSVGRLE
jgi:hypothetical protein